MKEILFLAHRIPYPPDKGDKIRSFNMLRALASRHRVHLGAFIDNPADWKYEEALREFCDEIRLVALKPPAAMLRSALALATRGAFTMAYYRDKNLRRWTENIARRRTLSGVFAFSSSMGQYALNLPLASGAVRVLDFCDVDSDKWRQYSRSHGFPLARVYAREARRLSVVEARYVREFDASLVISEAEAKVLREVTKEAAGRVRVVANGVDMTYFDPSIGFDNPFAFAGPAIVFTGAMDYHANVDAVKWFAQEVLPEVLRQVPKAVFVIVGSNPRPEVLALASKSGVMVTGRVADVRPYLAHAAVVVAPLRIARGVQNKVLEALSMGRQVIASENAVQGIPDADRAGVRVFSDAPSFAREVCRSLDVPGAESRGRDFVRRRYSWEQNLAPLQELFGAADSVPVDHLTSQTLESA